MANTTVTTPGQFRRAIRARKPVNYKFDVEATHGGYTVRITGLLWEPEDGYYGSWQKETLRVTVNGRALMLPMWHNRPHLPKTYGFVARCALAKAYERMRRAIW